MCEPITAYGRGTWCELDQKRPPLRSEGCEGRGGGDWGSVRYRLHVTETGWKSECRSLLAVPRSMRALLGVRRIEGRRRGAPLRSPKAACARSQPELISLQPQPVLLCFSVIHTTFNTQQPHHCSPCPRSLQPPSRASASLASAGSVSVCARKPYLSRRADLVSDFVTQDVLPFVPHSTGKMFRVSLHAGSQWRWRSG